MLSVCFINIFFHFENVAYLTYDFEIINYDFNSDSLTIGKFDGKFGSFQKLKMEISVLVILHSHSN